MNTLTLPQVKDTLADLSRSNFNESDLVSVLHANDDGSFSYKDNPVTLSAISKSQLLQFLNIPAKYNSICDTDLAAYNINKRISHYKNHSRLFRFTEDTNNTQNYGRVRAILSPSYTPLDHTYLLTMLEQNQSSLMSPENRYDLTISEAKMRLTIVNQNVPKMNTVNVGDPFSFGFNLYNSETGCHSVNTSLFILRLICSNGATSHEYLNGFTAAHRGSFENLVSRIHTDHRTKSQILPTIIPKLIELKETPLEDVENKVFRTQIPKKNPISETIMDFIDERLLKQEIPENGANKYSLFNAITYVGTHEKSLNTDQKIELQATAGLMLI